MSEQVRTMFAAIAGKYDVMNTVLTFGMHHAWRRRAVRLSGAAGGMSVLDCASGTGDLAFEFKKVVGTNGVVVATDFCKEMLDVIPSKSKDNGLALQVEVADAMNLQYPDNSYDIVSISYGIRNVDNPVTALTEMARVTKNGGKLVIIETGMPTGIAKVGYRIFAQYIVPLLGRLIARNTQAYTYLPETASRFPYGNAFATLVRTVPAIADVRVVPLMLGASYIYIASVQK
ncbi:MAG: ubiquinone/menaquinone biosynthesis methyltransferase, partial [Candidatus Kapabacteria bacterium]|nr:ubiquinone/menaquinone biosynthesis methyltransferase [Candidatus Kapabacteria bacterium]